MPTQRLKEKRVEEHAGEGEREKALWLLLLYVFSSTWACPMQIGLSQQCCLFYLKSSLWSSDLPLTFLCSIFAGFSLPCLLATTILDSFSLFYLPNRLNPWLLHSQAYSLPSEPPGKPQSTLYLPPKLSVLGLGLWPEDSFKTCF